MYSGFCQAVQVIDNLIRHRRKAETMALSITGTVTKVEIRKFDHPDPYVGRYSSFTEHWIYKLLIAIETPEGDEYWFYSPMVTAFVTAPPGAGFGVYGVNENDWIGKQQTQGTNCSGHSPVAKITVGQQLSIKGRIKKERTRFGIQLYYVKRNN